MKTHIYATDNIRSRQDFIHFLNDLLADYQANKAEWENSDLESFIDALARYAEDIDGFYKNTGRKIDADNASWKTFADIFMGATRYE